MSFTFKKPERPKDESLWSTLPKHSGKLVVAAIVLSLLFHIGSFLPLGYYTSWYRNLAFETNQNKSIKMKVLDASKDEELRKILEVPLAKTKEKPKDPNFNGAEDHKTEKETKIKEQPKIAKALDPGVQGNPDAKNQKIGQKQKPETSSVDIPQITTKSGLVFDSLKQKPRNPYENLLPMGSNDLAGQLKAGYQDFIQEEIEIGDRIDINTSSYRFVGYFTGLRKAIELVWNYPLDAARRGMQGEVGLEFAINKDGSASRVKVIKSSGFEILDKAIVDAIRLASPFSPLPESFKKDRIIVTGSFRYVLNGYASGGH